MAHRKSKFWAEYKEKLSESFESKLGRMLPLAQPGKVVHVSCRHDDGCPALRSRRLADCTCNPEICRMSDTEGEQDAGNIGELIVTKGVEA